MRQAACPGVTGNKESSSSSGFVSVIAAMWLTAVTPWHGWQHHFKNEKEGPAGWQ